MADNWTSKVEGDKLVITVDCSKKAIETAPLTKNEKSKLVASTRGTARIAGPGGTMFNLGLNLTCSK